jgi:hypothetical protein
MKIVWSLIIYKFVCFAHELPYVESIKINVLTNEVQTYEWMKSA